MKSEYTEILIDVVVPDDIIHTSPAQESDSNDWELPTLNWTSGIDSSGLLP